MASGLRQRFVTALLLAGLVIAVLFWLPPAAAVFAVMVVMLAGGWEWAGFCGWRSAAQRAAYVVAIGLAIALAWRYTATTDGLVPFLRVAALWWFAAFLWVILAAGRGGRTAAVVVGSAVILFDPIFQGLAISLMAGEVASLLLSRMEVPVMYYMSRRRRPLEVIPAAPSAA